jgi:hypothetical protein
LERFLQLQKLSSHFSFCFFTLVHLVIKLDIDFASPTDDHISQPRLFERERVPEAA